MIKAKQYGRVSARVHVCVCVGGDGIPEMPCVFVCRGDTVYLKCPFLSSGPENW